MTDRLLFIDSTRNLMDVTIEKIVAYDSMEADDIPIYQARIEKSCEPPHDF